MQPVPEGLPPQRRQVATEPQLPTCGIGSDRASREPCVSAGGLFTCFFELFLSWTTFISWILNTFASGV